MHSLMTLAKNSEMTRTSRLNTKLAKARAKQLDMAMKGRILESAGYAAQAKLIRAVQATKVSRRAVAAALASLSLLPALAAAQPTTVLTAEVAEELVQEHRRVTGSLQAVSRAAVAAQESGLVESVLVDEGSLVRKGDLIVSLDARRLNAQLEEARAEHANYEAIVAQRVAELDFTRLDRDRIQQAHNNGAASERELSEVETMLGVRESQLESTRRVVESTARRVDLLEIRLNDMQVRAPFDARVVSRHVEPGEWTEPGRPVATLVSTGTIEARLEVPERYASSVFANPELLFVQLASDGRSVPSVSVRPVPDVDERARTFQVFVTLDNTSGELAPGMAVNAWVPTSQESLALLAPKDSVIRDGRDAYVFRVNDNGDTSEADKTPVTVLFTWGDMLAVSSQNLDAGDEVVVEGNERLLPDAEITSASLTSRSQS
ncbi:MAG: efflux RND transporter periplasmic adaptor subunit [Planctomycetota bacterium]